mmetsp:Transcript_109910/g.295707  ORF Transcript_109910/g.295707 Transcript_109910/m.295707 type:complete len:320 (+) Transcript_109910:57-1016(+)
MQSSRRGLSNRKGRPQHRADLRDPRRGCPHWGSRGGSCQLRSRASTSGRIEGAASVKASGCGSGAANCDAGSGSGASGSVDRSTKEMMPRPYSPCSGSVQSKSVEPVPRFGTSVAAKPRAPTSKLRVPNRALNNSSAPSRARPYRKMAKPSVLWRVICAASRMRARADMRVQTACGTRPNTPRKARQLVAGEYSVRLCQGPCSLDDSSSRRSSKMSPRLEVPFSPTPTRRRRRSRLTCAQRLAAPRARGAEPWKPRWSEPAPSGAPIARAAAWRHGSALSEGGAPAAAGEAPRACMSGARCWQGPPGAALWTSTGGAGH